MTESLFSPLKYYKTEGRRLYAENASQLFEELVQRSGIDAEANLAAAKRCEELLVHCRKLKGRRTLFLLGCAGCLLPVGLGITALLLSDKSVWFPPGGIVLILAGAIPFFSTLLPGFRSTRDQLAEARMSAQQCKNQAADLLAPLDQQFTPRDSINLFQQTVPGFSFLDRFTPVHRACLQTFGFRETSDDSSSVLNTLAGTFNGNPFLFATKRICSMNDVTYTGSTTIHWEEKERKRVTKTRTVTDRKGNQHEETYHEWEYVTVEKSETLHAEYTAPKPCYVTHTDLCYGHHAAPELSFSRKPGNSHKLSKPALQTRVRSGEQKLIRKGTLALERNEDYTPMVNETFDVLFGAQDRNNSHQFLQLFTPMAQENTVALLTDDTLGGDVFTFRKNNLLNTVSCPDTLLEPSPVHYHDHSLEKVREQFLAHHTSRFRAMFACFAPLLAIPAYQSPPLVQHTCDPVSNSNFTLYEHESIANAFPAALVAPAKCNTQTIRKTEFLSAADGADLVRIHTYGFKSRLRTETCRVRGGDGHYHDVDVDWTEYIPVSKTTTISIRPAVPGCTPTDESDTVCLHNLSAKIIPSS